MDDVGGAELRNRLLPMTCMIHSLHQFRPSSVAVNEGKIVQSSFSSMKWEIVVG